MTEREIESVSLCRLDDCLYPPSNYTTSPQTLKVDPGISRVDAGISMTDKQFLAYNRYQRFLQVLLTGCGCWHAPTKSGKSTYYWSVCTLPMLFAYAMLNIRVSYMYRHHLAIMMKNIGVSITTMGTILKVSSFLINRRSLIDYHRTLTDLFEQELKQNEKIRMVMFSPLHGISTFAYIYFGIIITLLLTYLMPTLTVITHGILRFQLITNYTLPYSRGYGYLWTVPTGHLRHFHLFFEIAMITINCITCIGVDSVFSFYTYLLSSMMRAMTFRLTNPLPNDKFYDVLSTCVVKHQKLMRYCNALTHVYGPIIFWHTVTNAILLCALIFETVQLSEISIGKVFNFVTYSTLKLLQMFIYAWYGTVITSADEDLRNGIYFSEWPNSSLNCHVRTNVLLIMMQKPMAIKAFFSTVDIVMFTNFMNTTISYFFLLESIGDKGG